MLCHLQAADAKIDSSKMPQSIYFLLYKILDKIKCKCLEVNKIFVRSTLKKGEGIHIQQNFY